MARNGRNKGNSNSIKQTNSSNSSNSSARKNAGKRNLQEEIDNAAMAGKSIEETQQEDELLLSPTQSIHEIVDGSRRKSIPSEWMPPPIVEELQKSMENGKSTEQLINLNHDTIRQSAAPIPNMIEISHEDIAEELAYWDLAVILFVIGSNPNVGMVDGFCRRLWGKLNIDKTIPVKRGVFMVRFLNKEARDKALNAQNVMLDSNPVFLKQWEDGMDLDKAEFVNLPIWVNVLDLPLKYWGMLEKLMTTIGHPIKPDKATAMRDRIKYVRYLVEMNIKEEFPEQLTFRNEHGEVVHYPVEYEWKPQFCDKCKRRGHDTEKCKKEVQIKKYQRRIWVPKQQQNQSNSETEKGNDQSISKDKVVTEREDQITEDAATENQHTPNDTSGDQNERSSKPAENEQSDTSIQGENDFITVRRKSKKSYAEKVKGTVITEMACSGVQGMPGKDAQAQGAGISNISLDG